jgi:hypothetical protein
MTKSVTIEYLPVHLSVILTFTDFLNGGNAWKSNPDNLQQ